MLSALESKYKQTYGVSLDLSEQQLNDCNSASHGCGLGYPTNGFQYIANNSFGGVTTEAAYPFTGKGNGASCNRTLIKAPVYGLDQPGYRSVIPLNKLQMTYVSEPVTASGGRVRRLCATVVAESAGWVDGLLLCCPLLPWFLLGG